MAHPKIIRVEYQQASIPWVSQQAVCLAAFQLGHLLFSIPNGKKIHR
jgi:hypothetical protein